jgi:hypothetical protein
MIVTSMNVFGSKRRRNGPGRYACSWFLK